MPVFSLGLLNEMYGEAESLCTTWLLQILPVLVHTHPASGRFAQAQYDPRRRGSKPNCWEVFPVFDFPQNDTGSGIDRVTVYISNLRSENSRRHVTTPTLSQ